MTTRTDSDVIDLNALREERLAGVPNRRVKFGGRIWQLTPELPFEVPELHQLGHRRRILELLLADPGPKNAKDTSTEAERIAVLVDEFMACTPSEADMGQLIRRTYTRVI